ncbi:MAG: endolytic transglycosylase MltG [Clostridia bacterium]|nr:endolytic transglycosylase MltG [Clostridia bacterium]
MKTKRKRYNHQTLYAERQYGLYWYDWLWALARPLLICLGAGILVAGIALTAFNALGERFFWPVDEADDTPVSFVVESGSSLTRVANKLEEEGLIRNRTVLKYLVDFRGLSQKIQAGEYSLTRAMTLTEIIDHLATGDGNPITRKITIIPGWKAEDIAAYLVREGVASSSDAFLAICGDWQTFQKYYYIDEVLKAGNWSERKYLLEGYLAPDTYEVFTTATLDSIVQKLVSQTETVFGAEYHDRATAQGMTMDQAITLASIIEKEAKKDDFTKVSAIFHNRLQNNMPLGSDPTVKYTTNSEKMWLTEDQLNTESPYNTYRRTGLPIGPICSPSSDAIRAALYPDEQFLAEKYLYFCSTSPEEGTLVFTKTLQEHEAQVAIYKPLWQKYDQERGV